MSGRIPSFPPCVLRARRPSRKSWASEMPKRALPFLLTVAVFILDRITKGAIRTHISLWDAINVIPGLFNIVHTENPGIAFGLLANLPNPWRDVFLIGLSMVVLAIISAVLLRAGGQ